MPLAAESCPSYRIEMAFTGDGPCFSTKSVEDRRPVHQKDELVICLHLGRGLFGSHTLQSVFDLSSFVELYISSEIVLGLTPNNAATCSGKQQLQFVL